MKDYVKTDPHLFRRVKSAFATGIAALLALAALVPAPLQAPADPGRVPNPAKSAWFLLWTQELVSYSASLVYLIGLLGLLFLFLPWLPGRGEGERARWLPAGERPVAALTIAAFLGIVALTAVALFFRGENWSFVSPF